MGKKFEDILNRDYRWPKPGDRVIGRAGQGAHQYVAQDGFERHSLMGDGYFRAGEVLIDQCHRDPFRRPHADLSNLILLPACSGNLTEVDRAAIRSTG
jgi:hypothetical protein